MSKAVLFLSLVGITILFTVGLVNPNSPAMWLASTSVIFAVLRLAMMIALAVLLATHPPRSPHLRAAIGGLAIFLTAMSLSLVYDNDMGLLDSLSFLLFSVSAGLDVLEPQPRQARRKTVH